MIGGLNGLKGLDPRRLRRGQDLSALFSGYAAVRMRSIQKATNLSWVMREFEIYPEENFGGSKLTGTSFVTAGVTDVGATSAPDARNLFDGNLGNHWVESSAAPVGVCVGLEFGTFILETPPMLGAVGEESTFIFNSGKQIKSFRLYTYDAGRLPPTFAIDAFAYYQRGGKIYGSWRQLGEYSGYTYPGNSQWLGWASL